MATENTQEITTTIPLKVLRQIGLALENGYDEDEQRKTWGDETIDWINQETNKHEDALRALYEAECIAANVTPHPRNQPS